MQGTITRAVWCTLAAFLLLLAACGGAPVQQTTPEAQYQFAKEAIVGKNYVKALDTLNAVVKRQSDSELAVRANLTRSVLLAGMSEAYKHLAEAYMEGYRNPSARSYANDMRKMAMDYYGMARVRSVEYVEGFDLTMKHVQAGKTVALDGPFPDTAGHENPALDKIRHGAMISDDERMKAEFDEVEAGLARAVASTLGVGDDLNAARARMQSGSATVKHPALLVSAAGQMCQLSAIFGRKALDDDRLNRAFHERALATADTAIEKLKQEPDKKLEDTVKKIKKECQQVMKGG